MIAAPATATMLVFAVVLAVGGWSYWPMLTSLWNEWGNSPDYSHGFLVAPVAFYFLWARRDKAADLPYAPSILGLAPLAIGLVLRYLATLYYVEPVEHASLLFWVAGCCWLVCGGRVLLWALPSIGFLAFMFPLPFRLQDAFSWPLQRLATKASCWVLQTLGQPAFAMGNVIQIEEHHLEVAQACSGLRMMMGFFALCVAYAVLCDRRPWERLLVVASAIPVALACNVLRITVTGLLYAWWDAEVARKFTHDVAGWAMMPVALVFLAGLLWYLDHLFVEAEVTESTILVHHRKQV